MSGPLRVLPEIVKPSSCDSDGAGRVHDADMDLRNIPWPHRACFRPTWISGG